MTTLNMKDKWLFLIGKKKSIIRIYLILSMEALIYKYIHLNGKGIIRIFWDGKNKKN